MTIAGVKTARTHVRPGRTARRSAQPTVVARVTLAAPPARSIEDPVITQDRLAEEPAILASRRDIHVARRLRRREALLGLGVLVTTLGATVAVLDMLH